MDFRVDLTTFRGPLDLLLYLVRKHEVDVANIPIAEVTDQFLKYIEVLEQLDVDDVGDFIEMASTLLEMKSRLVLPSDDEETEELDDAREDLVQRLLEYKKYKDAASMLEEQSRDWQQHYPRLQNDLPPRKLDLGTQPIHELELWDLVSSLGRIMRDKQVTKPSNIVYDDTPIHVYMERIHTKLVDEKRASLSEMLEGGMHKSAMIGVFLAVLELARHHSVRTEQDHLHGEIWLVPDKDFSAEADFSQADSYGDRTINEDDLPSKPR
ncbi:MAG: segregation/condensation protein A [Planctomycetes bacterium]|nr:segregation/condensation protein A [Planctomycetota bacterium]